jgi:hypothetical protein
LELFFNHFYAVIDGWLIVFYRLSGIAMLDYLIGTFVLAMITVILGELAVSLAMKFNQGHVARLTAETDRMEAMSLAAYSEGKMEQYKALNQAATDSWARQFFSMMGYSMGIFWPLPFALGWMQTRFQDVAFPIVFPLSLVFRDGVGYIFTFIPLYIAARIIFKYMRPWLPYFKGVQKMLDETPAPKKPADPTIAKIPVPCPPTGSEQIAK